MISVCGWLFRPFAINKCFLERWKCRVPKNWRCSRHAFNLLTHKPPYFALSTKRGIVKQKHCTFHWHTECCCRQPFLRLKNNQLSTGSYFMYICVMYMPLNGPITVHDTPLINPFVHYMFDVQEKHAHSSLNSRRPWSMHNIDGLH